MKLDHIALVVMQALNLTASIAILYIFWIGGWW